MPVSSSRILDIIAEGCARYRLEGSAGISWTFHRSMTGDERLAFDLFLVQTKDELAWQPGTTESRFVARVSRMVNAIAPLTQGGTK